MNKIIAIKDNYSVEVISDLYDKNITVQLVDEINNITTTMAMWFNGKWDSDSPMGMNKFFEVVKEYPKVKRNVRKAFSNLKKGPEPSQNISKTWNCFRRRISIKIHNVVK